MQIAFALGRNTLAAAPTAARASGIGPSGQPSNGNARGPTWHRSWDRGGAGQGSLVGAARIPRNVLGSRSRGLSSAALVFNEDFGKPSNWRAGPIRLG